ncbi:MAG: hypothetical protein Kow0063_40770 [Anaerolineae bacterium]
MLIFASATVAVQRDPQRWLAVQLVPQVSADYSVDAAGLPKLAPVRPEIVAAVRQDALVTTPAMASPSPTEDTVGPPLLVFRPTRTPTLTSTPTMTPALGLRVSAGGPYHGEEGRPIGLVAQAVSQRLGQVSYRWDLDRDGVYDDGTGARATVVYYDEGEYQVAVEAWDGVEVASAVARVSVVNVAPAIYGLADGQAQEGERVSFSATVVDPGHDVLLYSWDFGDGGVESGTLKPKHTYVQDGEYMVRFRVEDNDGGVNEAYFVMRVSNVAPSVEAGPDQQTDEGHAVTLTGRAQDAGEQDQLRYSWDLDYDGKTFTEDASGPSVTTVYPDGPAEVVAALRVEDGDGGVGLDTLLVRVNNVAPALVAVQNNGPVAEGSELTLVVQATDVGADTLQYAFDWDNDGVYDAVEQAAQVSNIWYDEGDYVVGVRVDDGDGGVVYSTTLVSAYNVAPVAVASVSGPALEGTQVNFDGSGSWDAGIYDVLTYGWDFGDGSVVTGPERVVGHAYADNGTYNATLTVQDDSGAASVAQVGVSVLNANPVADVGPDRTVDEGGRLRITAQASDPGAGDVLSVAWDFDYDGVHFDEDAVGTTQVEQSYADGPARYVVAFRVRDDDYPYPEDGGGQIGETIDTLEVIVNNVAPVAEANGPYSGGERQAIELVGTAVDVAADVLTYDWDVDGDGDYDLVGPNVSYAWEQAGEYEVRLRVRDDDGGVGYDTAQVRIGNAPPTAEAGGPYNGQEGRPIVLTGTLSTDPTNDPLTYTWDLDYDGIFETPGEVVTYTWPDNGQYTVTLLVDDGRGGQDTDDAIVNVVNVPPVVSAGGPYAGTTGITLTLVATATDVPADPLTYTWDLDDDGVFDDGVGRQTSYVWTATGIYTVAVQVNDGDGGVVTDVTTVNVNMLVPFAWLGVSYFLVRSGRSSAKRKEARGDEQPYGSRSGLS